MPNDEELRRAMLEAAEQQLVASPDRDVATRAVCDAVGVSQPVLYRLFGDKRGLLDALADAGLDRYATRKAELEVTADPVADLYVGWDDHMDFAAEHPALYQLMFAPRPWSTSRARDGVFALLLAALTRCAAAGRLATDPDTAARMILSANIGYALNRIAQPDGFGAIRLSHALRDAMFAAVLVDGPTRPAADPLSAAAARLGAQLTVAGTDALAPEETALLGRWLDRLTTPSEDPSGHAS